MEKQGSELPGLVLVAVIGGGASALAVGAGAAQHGLGALTLAILLGALLGNLAPALGRGCFRPGLGRAQKHGLRLGVALYGFNLSLQQIFQVGLPGLAVDLLLVSSTLGLGWWWGTRWLGLDRETALLTSAGSAICGAAAVVATVPLLRLAPGERAEKSAVAVATVLLFGSLAMVLYPFLHSWLGVGGADFGRYVGSTVHEVAQVVAIGDGLGGEGARVAVTVKMIRVLLLLPFLLLLSRLMARRGGAAPGEPIAVPWFALAFLLLAGVNSLDLLPREILSGLRQLGTLLLTAAMAALGLDTTLARIRRAGWRPLLLGAGLFAHLVLVGGLINWLFRS